MSSKQLVSNTPKNTPRRSSRFNQYIFKTPVNHITRSKSKPIKSTNAKNVKTSQRRTKSRRKSWKRRKRRTTTVGQGDGSAQNIFRHGLKGAQRKLKSRLHDRGYSWKFIQTHSDICKKKMAANDVCEALIKSVKYLISINTSMHYTQAGNLVGFEKNDGNTFVSVEENLNNFATTIFNHRDSVNVLNAKIKQQKEEALKNAFKRKVQRSKKKQQDDKQRALEKFKLFRQYIVCKKYFGVNEDDFYDIYYSTVKEIYKLHPRSDPKLQNIEKRFVKDILKYFIHCLNLKESENIILSKNLNTLIEKAKDLIDSYGFWTYLGFKPENDGCKAAENCVLKNILKVIHGKHYDTAYVDNEYDYFHNDYFRYERVVQTNF